MFTTTVIIVCNKKSRRDACHRLLQDKAGIEVLAEARSGLEAIAAAVRYKPDILLLNSNLIEGRNNT